MQPECYKIPYVHVLIFLFVCLKNVVIIEIILFITNKGLERFVGGVIG